MKNRNIDKSDAIFEEFTKKTAIPFLSLKAVRKTCTVYDSKLGGIPYLPKDCAYPCATDRTNGAPLRLLAQLNFAQFPPLPGFPIDGILQFYVEESDVYGINFDHPLEQSTFRILYHKEILQDVTQLRTVLPAVLNEESDDFPFQGEFRLLAALDSTAMSVSDFRFDSTYLDIYKQSHETNAKSVYNLDSSLWDEISDKIDSTGHRMGGYPFFSQSDPREETFAEHTVMLLQIDSEGDGDDEIIWGDCGVANFFITPEALARLDFSSVLYNWDCY